MDGGNIDFHIVGNNEAIPTKTLAIDLANRRNRGELQPADVTEKVNTYVEKAKFVNKNNAQNEIITDYNNQLEKLKLKSQ